MLLEMDRQRAVATLFSRAVACLSLGETMGRAPASAEGPSCPRTQLPFLDVGCTATAAAMRTAKMQWGHFPLSWQPQWQLWMAVLVAQEGSQSQGSSFHCSPPTAIAFHQVQSLEVSRRLHRFGREVNLHVAADQSLQLMARAASGPTVGDVAELRH